MTYTTNGGCCVSTADASSLSFNEDRKDPMRRRLWECSRLWRITKTRIKLSVVRGEAGTPHVALATAPFGRRTFARFLLRWPVAELGENVVLRRRPRALAVGRLLVLLERKILLAGGVGVAVIGVELFSFAPRWGMQNLFDSFLVPVHHFRNHRVRHCPSVNFWSGREHTTKFVKLSS